MPALTLVAIMLVLHFVIWRWGMRASKVRTSSLRKGLWTLLMESRRPAGDGCEPGIHARSQRTAPGRWISTVRGAALAWALSFGWIFLAVWLWRKAPAFDPRRRFLLKAASVAVVSVPALAGGFGTFIARTRLEPGRLKSAWTACRPIWTDCGWHSSPTST